MDEHETQIKEHLTRLIESLSKSLPDSSKATADLWKFAKLHDRRCYHLIRFCIASESDYRTVVKAIVSSQMHHFTGRTNRVHRKNLLSALRHLPLVY